MHRHNPRVRTDAEDAAQILRGYKERIERLEEDSSGGDSVIQLYRNISEVVTTQDSISITTDSDAGFDWNTSEWGFDEWDEAQ